MRRRSPSTTLAAPSVADLRRRLLGPDWRRLTDEENLEAEFARELMKLTPSDRRAVRVIVQRVADIEVSEGSDAAEEALEGVFQILLRAKQRLSA